MKGTFLAFLFCLALALGGLGAAAHTLGTQGQGVEVSARPRQGDPAAAQGLVATQQAQYQPGRNRPGQWNGALLWDLTIPLDNPAASRTACTFHLRTVIMLRHSPCIPFLTLGTVSGHSRSAGAPPWRLYFSINGRSSFLYLTHNYSCIQ